MFEAREDLAEAAFDFAVKHQQSLRDLAANGCVASAKFIAAVNALVTLADDVDQANVDEKFAEIVDHETARAELGLTTEEE